MKIRLDFPEIQEAVFSYLQDRNINIGSADDISVEVFDDEGGDLSSNQNVHFNAIAELEDKQRIR